MGDDVKDMAEDAAPKASGDQTENSRAADKSDTLANALEKVAFKLHDFGNWLLGFIR